MCRNWTKRDICIYLNEARKQFCIYSWPLVKIQFIGSGYHVRWNFTFVWLETKRVMIFVSMLALECHWLIGLKSQCQDLALSGPAMFPGMWCIWDWLKVQDFTLDPQSLKNSIADEDFHCRYELHLILFFSPPSFPYLDEDVLYMLTVVLSQKIPT